MMRLKPRLKLIFRMTHFKPYSIKYRQYNNLSYIHNVGEDPLRPLTVGQLLEETANKFGDREAVVSIQQNKRLNFQQVLNQADQLAAGLRSLGVNYGDRVGIWAPNIIEWYITKMACARAGAVLVAMNPAYTAKELEYCINKVGIKSIICDHKQKYKNNYDIFNTICADLDKCEPGKLKIKNVPSLESIIMVSDENLKGVLTYNEVLETATNEGIENIRKTQGSVRIDDPCNIQFTSGTTGLPKAAVVSHFHLVNNSFFVGKRNELWKKHHKICVQVPLFHAFGVVITTMAALNHAATLVFGSATYDPNKFLDALRDEKCTIVHGTPTMYVDLINKQKERKEDISPEIAVSGGAPCSPHLFKQMLEVLKVKKVKSVFGLTETTAVVFQSLFNDDETKSTETVGHVQEHVEVKVVDEKNNIVPFGTPGELCVRGYMNMLGYWNDEAKTKETIGNDFWLKTGDQFVLEKNGYGRIVGRLKEMIIRGGENIFPREIEDYLNTHENILETHVIGLPHERLGEEVCACVRVKEGTTITQKDIVQFCKDNISHFKIPTKLLVVDAFPKTTSGKIQKFKLIDIVREEFKNL